MRFYVCFWFFQKDESLLILNVFISKCRNEAKLRGIKKGSVNVDYNADGVASIHFARVKIHIKGVGLLDLGSKKYSGGSLSSTPNVDVTGQIEKALLNKHRFKIWSLLKF